MALGYDLPTWTRVPDAEDGLSRRNRIHCHYMMALGYLGLGDQSQISSHSDQILAMESSHFGAHIHKRYLEPI